MATYSMPGSVEVLVNNAVELLVVDDASKAKLLEKVQNGLDTVFSEATKVSDDSKWRVKGNKEGFKISNTLKRNWEIRNNAPGKLLVFCIGVGNLTHDIGEFEFSLPPFVNEWLKELAK